MSNDNKKKFPVGKVIAAVCAVAFLVGVVFLTVYFVKSAFVEPDMDELRDAYVQEIDKPVKQDVPANDVADTDTTVEQEDAENDVPQQDGEAEPEEEALPISFNLDGYDVPLKLVDFATLQQNENGHIYAWITIPGTGVDYPIVQHPDLADYYLDHNLDGSKGYPGGIYTQLYNSKDWTDANTVIYGHNMKNGTMFGSLHQYEDSKFFDKNKFIYIYTEDGRVKVYEIFAAYEYPDINLVTTYYLLGEESYGAYLKNMYSLDGMNNNFDTDIQVGVKDKIVTLATCISNKPDQRYLVQGVLRAEGSLQ